MLESTMIIPLHQARFFEQAKAPVTVRLAPVQDLPWELREALATILRNSWARKGYLFDTRRLKDMVSNYKLMDLAERGYLYYQRPRHAECEGTIVKGFILRPLTIALCMQAGLCSDE